MFGDACQARTNAAMLILPMIQPQAALAQNPLLAAGKSLMYLLMSNF